MFLTGVGHGEHYGVYPMLAGQIRHVYKEFVPSGARESVLRQESADIVRSREIACVPRRVDEGVRRRAQPVEAGSVRLVQAEDGIRDIGVTGVQTCALPI